MPSSSKWFRIERHSLYNGCAWLSTSLREFKLAALGRTIFIFPPKKIRIGTLVKRAGRLWVRFGSRCRSKINGIESLSRLGTETKQASLAEP